MYDLYHRLVDVRNDFVKVFNRQVDEVRAYRCVGLKPWPLLSRTRPSERLAGAAPPLHVSSWPKYQRAH